MYGAGDADVSSPSVCLFTFFLYILLNDFPTRLRCTNERTASHLFAREKYVGSVTPGESEETCEYKYLGETAKF
jgi:hypothetical protein